MTSRKWTRARSRSCRCMAASARFMQSAMMPEGRCFWTDRISRPNSSPLRCAGENLDESGRGVGSFEREHPGQEFVQQDAGREDVASSINGERIDLFRREVVQAADQLPSLHDSAFPAGDPSDAEVDDFSGTVGKQDHVSRLDVAMNDIAVVGILEAIADLHDDVELFDHGNGAPLS